MKLNSLYFPLGLAVGLLAAAIVTVNAAETRPPNIVVIIADDLGFADVGVGIHSNRELRTPNIDSIATAGVRFTSGYVSAPYCSPTRAGLLTGRYQQRFGHEFNPNGTNGLPVTEVTLADRLTGAGYATGAIGKWHLGTGEQFHPLNRGFAEFFGFLGAAHSYTNLSATGNNPIYRGHEPVEEKEYLTDAFTREAVAFIERNKEQPFYLHLSYNAVHTPLDPSPKHLEGVRAIAEEKRRNFAAVYAALDEGVGNVLTKLREEGLEQNTVIFFLSDNGGHPAANTSKNDPLRGSKFQTWEGGVHVPFYVRWRNKLNPGQRFDPPVIQLDIHPTALAIAGIEVKPEWKLDGVNLLPYLTGEKQGAPHEALFWRFGEQFAVRQGDWKLVKAYNGPGGFADVPREAAGTNTPPPAVAEGGTPAAGAPAETPARAARPLAPYFKPITAGAELFNLAKDIGERTNLADEEPAKLQELVALWNKWNAELVEPAWGSPALGGTFGGPPYVYVPEPPAASPAVAAVRPTPTAAAAGPWKLGDNLTAADSPQIASKPFAITAEITPESPEGVIAALGASGNGFALFLNEGRLSFAVRVRSQLTTVSAAEPLPAGSTKVEAQFGADGKITLLADGAAVAEGKAGGLIPRQPAEGLTVGDDGSGAVGEYAAPNNFTGKVENVTFRFL